MKSSSKTCLFLLVLLVVGIALTTNAREQPVADRDTAVATIVEVAPVEPEAPQAPEPVCAAESTAALAFSGSPGFGFPLCTSQAHCESLCAPYGGICVRQFCICD